MLTTLTRLSSRCLWALLLCLCAVPALAQQTFNSGSTGANGAFSPTTLPAGCTLSGVSITCTLPADGVYNFTTFDLPSGYFLFFNRNARNTPITILTSGNCTITGSIRIQGENGTISLTGFGSRPQGGIGAAGGFDGGGGGLLATLSRNGINGDGPGGGGSGRENAAATVRGGGGGGANFLAGVNGASSDATLAGAGGRVYGSYSLPVIGGSGGGGSPASATTNGAGGGGGGGAILVASSGTMTVLGSIWAYGGAGSSSSAVGSGGGAGGSIRLMATTITGSSAIFYVYGGAGGTSGATAGGAGGAGFVRAEAFNFTNFSPDITPNASTGVYFQGAPPASLSLSAFPTLRITTVAGTPVPTTPRGTFNNSPDIPFTTAPTNPVTIGLAASNIPLGSQINVILAPETGAITTVQSTALAGTVASSTATASVALPPGRSLLNALITIDANPQIAQFIDGERVKQIEIAARMDGSSETTYITESGKRIKQQGE